MIEAGYAPGKGPGQEPAATWPQSQSQVPPLAAVVAMTEGPSSGIGGGDNKNNMVVKPDIFGGKVVAKSSVPLAPAGITPPG